MKYCILLCVLFFSAFQAKGQDTTQPWFPGGDPGFYRYIEDRLQALGFQRPAIDRNGETVIFEFYINDSGYFDSVKVQQCFNFQLCFQLRQILNTMPRVNAAVVDGRTVAERRVYVLVFRAFRDSYILEPAIEIPYSGSLPSKMKWALALVAVIAMFIVVFK